MWSGKRIGKVPLSIDTIRSLTNAVKDIAKGQYAPPILVEERLRICSGCPYGGTQCDLCGCFLKTKVSLLNSKCPIEKWSSPSCNTRKDSSNHQNTTKQTD